MMSALFLKKTISTKRTISDRIISFFHRLYEPVLQFALRAKMLIVGVVLVLFAVSVLIFSRLGGEFIPTLEEGDLALHQILPTGTALRSEEHTSELQSLLRISYAVFCLKTKK